MVRYLITLFCLLSFTEAAQADEAEKARGPNNASESAKPTETFESLRMLGDLERLAGRDIDAAISYARALALRHDPLVAGRLGVILVKVGKYEDAAEKLLDAIQLAADAAPTERKAFHDAFEKTLAQGAWVHVSLSHAGAQVDIDGAAKNAPGRSAFYTFVGAGEHVVHAHLDGYDDVAVTFTAQKRKEARVVITFVPRVPPLPELAATTNTSSLLVEPPQLPPSTTPASTSGLPKQEDPWGYPDPNTEKPKEDTKGFHGSVFVGPVVLFGVASWSPAVGAVLGGAWKPNQYFSLGLEGRAAWLTVGVGGEPISAMTAGGLLSACGYVKWFFGCALGHLGVTNIEFSEASFVGKKGSFFLPGIGGRVGAKVRFSRSFSAHVSVDALRLSNGFNVVVEQTVIASQVPVMVGVQVGGGWEF